MVDIRGERRELDTEHLQIIRRESWGARQSYASARPCQPAKQFFLHISVTPLLKDEAAAMRAIERIGQSRFQIGCSYNAAVFPSGRIYEGQPLTRRGAHTVNNFKRSRCAVHGTDLRAPSWNNNVTGRAIVLPQNVDDPVTDEQIDGAAHWGAAQIRSGLAEESAHWCGHRCVTAKECPGLKGYNRIPELQRLTDYYVKNSLYVPEVVPPKIEEKDTDMDLVLFVVADKDTTDPAYAIVGDRLRHVSGTEVAARQQAGGKIAYVHVPASDDVWKLEKL